MEIKIDNHRNLRISHKLKKNEMYKINKGRKSISISIFNKPQVCTGFSSRTESGRDILLLDYDNCEKYVVLDDIKLISEMFLLPPAYLFTTDERKENKEIIGNYHVIFLSSYSPRDIYEILKFTHIDSNFQDSPIRSKYKSWVLRISNKIGRKRPKFLGLIGKDNLNQEISQAHMELLSKLYPKIEHPQYTNLDGGKNVRLQAYETSA